MRWKQYAHHVIKSIKKKNYHKPNVQGVNCLNQISNNDPIDTRSKFKVILTNYQINKKNHVYALVIVHFIVHTHLLQNCGLKIQFQYKLWKSKIAFSAYMTVCTCTVSIQQQVCDSQKKKMKKKRGMW